VGNSRNPAALPSELPREKIATEMTNDSFAILSAQIDLAHLLFKHGI
jgi:hypothetical protein